ncbi:MAG TPA: glycosyltransferase family 39 protein [Pyrinomonadaceae bacterium]|nr:glycosyltransferase family 39 protein [Pyrinomonadaceae bacterium]
MLLFIFASLAIFSNLGLPKDFVRAESYFALGSQLMVESGDWLSPHAPDEPVLNKPPLQYWLTGLFYKLFGYGYWTARLPSGLAALGVLLVVYLLGARLFNHRAGLLAAACLMTSYIFYAFSRTAMSDMLLSLCVSAALACFMLSLTGKSGGRETLLTLLGHLFVAFGVLAKGPVAIVLVGGPLFFELLISRDFSMLKRLRIPVGALVVVCVAGPYFLLLYLNQGAEPLRSFFIGENLQRFTGKIYGYATVPLWRLPLAFIGDFAPWSLLLIPAIYFDWKPKRKLSTEARRARRLLYLWLLFPLVFFSFSHFKLDYYLLPSMPACAIVVAGFYARLDELSKPARTIAYALTIFLTFVMIVVAFTSAGISAALMSGTAFAWLLAALTLGAFLFIPYSLYRGAPRRIVWALCFSIWTVLMLYGLTLLPALSGYNPLERLAAVVPHESRSVYTSYGASNWANTLTFHLPQGTKVTRLINDKEGTELQELLRDDADVVALINEAEYVRLKAVGIPLRVLAEGETLGHGGITSDLLRSPSTERLLIVRRGG